MAVNNLLMNVAKAARPQLYTVGVFSMIVNLLMLTSSIYMMQVFDRVLSSQSVDTLLYLTLIAVIALAILAMLEGARQRIMALTAAWGDRILTPEVFARGVEAQLRGQPYRSEGLRDVSTVRMMLSSPILFALFDAPWVPIYIAVMFVLHPVMGWIAAGAALMLLMLTIITELLTAKPIRQATMATMRQQRRADAMIRNAEVIDGLGMLRAARARWSPEYSASLEQQVNATALGGSLSAFGKFVRLAVQMGVTGIGAYLVLQQELTAGAMIAGSIILGRALAPIEQLIGGWRTLVAARESWKRLGEALSRPPLREGEIAPPVPQGRLTVENVTFALANGSRPILRGISFNLDKGEGLSIIGPSAAGKTTLVRLLMGTLRPVGGIVRLDGADIFRWPREDLGRHIGYLPQDVELFEGTVFDNIARLEQADPEDVYTATRLAGCHEMILRLPKGYETEIGEGGIYLSGGQKQMIGFARAVFGNPRLIVLDEPNANLDGEGEQALIQAVSALKAQGTTVVLVSHRPSLVQATDKILVLREGSVDMFGPRDEVLAQLRTRRLRPVGDNQSESGPRVVESTDRRDDARPKVADLADRKGAQS